MNDSTYRHGEQDARGSFPLASLALLITVFAVALACADLNRWSQIWAWFERDWPWRIVGVWGGAGLFGGAVGIAHALIASATGKARWIAPLAGILAGEFGVLILITPGPMWRTFFAIGVLLGTTILLRLNAE